MAKMMNVTKVQDAEHAALKRRVLASDAEFAGLVTNLAERESLANLANTRANLAEPR